MRLEDQLNEKADKEFDTAYGEMYRTFEKSFYALTKMALSSDPKDAKDAECLMPLRQMWDVHSYGHGCTKVGNDLYTMARGKHRSLYIAAFIKRAEEREDN